MLGKVRAIVPATVRIYNRIAGATHLQGPAICPVGQASSLVPAVDQVMPRLDSEGNLNRKGGM